MTDRDLMQQALEALESSEREALLYDAHPSRVQGRAAITALRERLARQEQVPAFRTSHAYSVGFKDGQAARQEQEPYLYVYEYDHFYGLHREFRPRNWNGMEPTRTVPLYTAPQPAIPAGYALVPVEPTTDMLAALSGEWHPSRHRPDRYAAMIAAAQKEMK